LISPAEDEFIKRVAYIPEHMPGYGTAISGGEMFLLKNYACYRQKEFLIFIGYPLQEPFDEKEMERTLAAAVERFVPSRVSLIAPSISRKDGERGDSDAYYQLDLDPLRIPAKVRNMIHRASQGLHVEKGREFLGEHRQLVEEFLKTRRVGQGTHTIFQKIQGYLAAVPTAWIFSARTRDHHLAGFDIAEFGAQDYAFYLFNFRSAQNAAPGTSDLLLYELIRSTQEQGKRYINLGLGVNAGVTFFKKKWGGRPFLNHEFVLFEPRKISPFEALLREFLRG